MNQERISVVDLREGDTIFIHSQNFLSRDQRSHMQAWAKQQFPNNEVVILDGGLQVSVARPGSNELMERIALATEQFAKQFNEVSACGKVLLTEQA